MSVVPFILPIFGKDHLLLGSDSCQSGMDHIFWLKHIKNCISINKASQFLYNQFVEVDIKGLRSLKASIENAQDNYMIFQHTPDGETWFKLWESVYHSPDPPDQKVYPNLPSGIELVSSAQLEYAKSLGMQIKEASDMLKEAQKACAPVLDEIRKKQSHPNLIIVTNSRQHLTPTKATTGKWTKPCRLLPRNSLATLQKITKFSTI